MCRLPLSFQSAVGFEYAGKTEKHASQKGDVATRIFVQMCTGLELESLQHAENVQLLKQETQGVSNGNYLFPLETNL